MPLKVILKKSRRFNPSPKGVRRAVAKVEQKIEAGKAHQGKVLDQKNHDPAKQLSTADLVTMVVTLAQTLAEKKFYPYQIELAYRLVESVLLHDGDVITALMSRQVGKTETLGSLVAAVAIIFPKLAKDYPDDWKFNITDSQGSYRGYADGVRIGIYAPKLEQANIMFERVKKSLETDTAIQILRELGITLETKNGNTIRLSNGSRIMSETASVQSKIEGETHHLLVCEECQDIDDNKIKKSLHPMVASTMGTIVKIGTATTRKCDFYTSIKINERMAMTVNGKKNHFFYPYTVCQQYNSMYAKYIEKERIRLGETSDEFRTSYCCEWIFERGMFVTDKQLFNVHVVQTDGIFSLLYPHAAFPRRLFQEGYSLIASIDWGRQHDSTVLTLGAVNWNAPCDSGYTMGENGEVMYNLYKKHVLNWVEFVGDNYEHQWGEIQLYLDRLPLLRKIITDSNTCGQPQFDRLAAHYRPRGVDVEEFNFNAHLKSDGYKSFYADICGKRFTFPAADSVRRTIEYTKFVNQMLDLKKEYSENIMKVAHPDEKGAHDDFSDSSMLFCWGANTPARNNTFDIVKGNPFYRR